MDLGAVMATVETTVPGRHGDSHEAELPIAGLRNTESALTHELPAIPHQAPVDSNVAARDEGRVLRD